MRVELERIAFIEKYLLDALTDTEKQVFETRMATDSDFKNEVEIQKELMQSLEQLSLQQTIQKAQNTYTFWKFWKRIGCIAIPILFALITWYFMNISDKTSSNTEAIPIKIEEKNAKSKSIQVEKQQKEIVAAVDTITNKKITTIQQTESSTAVVVENTVQNPLDTIEAEFFNIITAKDTIIETQHGIVFLIPSNAFVDTNQNAVTGSVQLEIKEALDAQTIMNSGLSTLHNGKPLETAGMFFMEATKNGQKLQIHPKKEIIADVPTQHYKEGMQLFDGEVLKDGTMNWINPKPIDKDLIPKDIYSLNFYPPKYLETLAEKGYDDTDKQFTDSLYFSFGNTEKASNIIDVILEQELRNQLNTIPQDIVYEKSKDSVTSDTLLNEALLGLDPLKVKTIWNERYQNTFIATKAFEERLRVIHQHCDVANSILDVYVNNLNRDLYEIDQMIATQYEHTLLREQFEFFAAQNLTNVATANSDVSKLNEYYIQQQKVYRLALEKTQHKIDSLVKVDKKYQAFSKQQLQNYYSDELAITTDNVSKSLAISLPRRFNRTINNQTNVQTNTISREVSTNRTSVARIIKKEKRKRRYRAPIRRTGWKNIDRVINENVIASVQSRTNRTIQNNKKSVTITYSEYEVSIENTERFDKLFVYLVPFKFNSFIRLKAENNRFTYKLNDLLKYRMYCIAYKNDIPFYLEKTIRNTSDKVQLRQITETILRDKLASMHSNNNSLETEILYQTTRKTNEKILKKYREVMKLKKEIKNVIFPCVQYGTLKDLVNDAFEAEITAVENIDFIENVKELPLDLVEIAPIFPGCESLETQAARKKCMSDNIQKIVNRYTSTDIFSKYQKTSGTHRFFTMFTIDTTGIVTNIKVRTNHPEIETEIKRVLELIPKMKPASHNGAPVHIKYTLPIIYRVE